MTEGGVEELKALSTNGAVMTRNTEEVSGRDLRRFCVA